MTGRPTYRWERVEPEHRCSHPDGHESIDIVQFGSDVPVQSVCPHCGQKWTIVVLPVVV